MARITRLSLSGRSFNALTEHQQTESVAATGEQAQTTLGQIRLTGWFLCNTSQTPNWALVNDAQ
jgi:hypothetical protein